jgi:hypothetical protein
MTTPHVWDFYEAIALKPRARLTRTERTVAAICDFRQETNSGGFDAYFRYSAADTAIVALEDIASILGTEWHSLLAEAMSLLGEPYPPDSQTRADLLDELEQDDELSALDDRFYALEASTDADELLSRALAN